MRQHNRRCVYVLLITESTMTLYMFDRSGVCRSCPIDIHKRAADFVRLLLGVWSPDDAVVGFDTTISWDQDERGLWRRHIAGRNEDDEPCRYPLAAPAPVCERWSIEGCGTVCWAATDADGERVLIKDQWRDAGKRPEWEFLDAARGMSGVCQVIHGGDGALVSTLRGITVPEYQRPFFADRQFSRLVLRDYGSCNISKFKGHKDLLFGFRDTVAGELVSFLCLTAGSNVLRAGHQRLWNTGILHGNVNMENILLTSQHAPPGGRGILIGLDLAMWLEGHVDHSAPNLHNQVCSSLSSFAISLSLIEIIGHSGIHVTQCPRVAPQLPSKLLPRSSG
jgi:hypothetical protein